jgi:hypothetical protein
MAAHRPHHPVAPRLSIRAARTHPNRRDTTVGILLILINEQIAKVRSGAEFALEKS